MIRGKPLHNFIFEYDEDGFYNDLDCLATPWIDVCVILHLARIRKPKTFLEIGTHRGTTTRIIAEKFPQTQITTVDPGDQIAEEKRPKDQVRQYLRQEEIGSLVNDCENVQIIKRPFLEIDWEAKRFDMIFVDGNHRLPHILFDSHRALELVSDPGVIIWHDKDLRDVKLALEQLEVQKEIVSLHNTWIAFLDTH